MKLYIIKISKTETLNILVVILLQINCNYFSSVKGLWLSLNVHKQKSISNKSFADDSSSNIIRLQIPMPMACQDLFLIKIKFSITNMH